MQKVDEGLGTSPADLAGVLERLERIDGSVGNLRTLLETLLAEGAPQACNEVAQSRRSNRTLPSAKDIRDLIRNRKSRERFFRTSLFADPAWDILLDLAAARVERVRVSVTSLCIASGVPATTALRWIALMIEEGLLVREDDINDKRRAFIALSEDAARKLSKYFESIGFLPEVV